MIPELALVVIMGLLVGSFLNVVIHRLPRDASVVRPRSACVACQAPIAWHENIPLISYLLLRGKCANCGKKISARYPFVELLTAVLFYFSWRGLGFDIAQFRLLFFISICIAITFIDFDFRIIPDELSLGGWAVGLLTCFADFRNDWMHLVLASIAGFGLFLLFGMAYEKVTGRVGLGGGDIKFMGTIGAFLGLGGLWSSLLLSSILGSIIGLAYGAYQARSGKVAGSVHGSMSEGLLKTSIPYGPFLVAGALIELFFEVSKWIIV
jgi:leader peptidase (prepilin peptidase)/N-methyltransferase